jgi:hypothetical protein
MSYYSIDNFLLLAGTFAMMMFAHLLPSLCLFQYIICKAVLFDNGSIETQKNLPLQSII